MADDYMDDCCGEPDVSGEAAAYSADVDSVVSDVYVGEPVAESTYDGSTYDDPTYVDSTGDDSYVADAGDAVWDEPTVAPDAVVVLPTPEGDYSVDAGAWMAPMQEAPVAGDGVDTGTWTAPMEQAPSAVPEGGYDVDGGDWMAPMQEAPAAAAAPQDWAVALPAAAAPAGDGGWDGGTADWVGEVNGVGAGPGLYGATSMMNIQSEAEAVNLNLDQSDLEVVAPTSILGTVEPTPYAPNE